MPGVVEVSTHVRKRRRAAECGDRQDPALQAARDRVEMGLMPFVTIKGRRLEYELIAASDAAAPTLVLLHEGLGSLAQWRDFPSRLAQATGCATLVYSRLGYGQSDALAEARSVDYMHFQALATL